MTRDDAQAPRGLAARLPLAALVAAVAGVGMLGFAALVHVRWEQSAREEVGQAARGRLEVVARALGADLPGEVHGGPDELSALRDRLGREARAAGLGPGAVALRTEGAPEIVATLSDGQPRSRGPYRDDRGAWVSSYAPVRRADGQIVAVLAVDERVEDAERAAEARVRERELWLVAIGVLCLPLLVLGLVFFVLRPLSALSGSARRCAEGDLVTPVDEVGIGSEAAELGAALTAVQRALAGLVREMNETGELLDHSIGSLKQATTAQGRTIAAQAASLQQTSVTAQQIKQNSLTAAHRAQSILGVAERADELGRTGEASIEQSLEQLGDLRAQVAGIAQAIQALGERSEQIGGITLSVKDLADQSNMLALNAAIEAVRSGEHGRSFAVVAREIRALADQSIQATRRVRDILEDISGALTMAIAIAEAGALRMEQGLGEMRQFGESFRELARIVRDDAAAVRQIAAAVSQQNVGVSQIFAALTDQTKMMDETVARVATTERAAAALQEVGEGIRALAAKYRV